MFTGNTSRDTFSSFLMTVGENVCVRLGSLHLYELLCHLPLTVINPNLMWSLQESDFSIWLSLTLLIGFSQRLCYGLSVSVSGCCGCPCWGFPNPYDIQVFTAAPSSTFSHRAVWITVSAEWRGDFISSKVLKGMELDITLCFHLVVG